MDEVNEVQDQQGQGDLAELVDIGNQSLDAIAAQQQYDDAPAIDDQPDTEPSFVEDALPVERHTSFSALDDALSDIEELEHDGFYEKINESHLKDLPPVARRILHNFRVDRKQQGERHTTEMQGLMTKIEQRERSLTQSERDFSKRQWLTTRMFRSFSRSPKASFQTFSLSKV